MRLRSTGGYAPDTTFVEAVLQGLAPDGGLYLPTDVPRITADDLERWRELGFGPLSVALAQRWLGDELANDVVERLVGDALTFPAPVRRLTNRLFALELFHGPTLAFKDFGARFLGRFFGHALAQRDREATILVATSGDTGSAVAHGFAGVPRVRVVILYPAGKVSPFQESQMATLGGNVHALRLPGTFDDCQRLVKAAFRDPGLARLQLSSANSINIGRLIPQSFYYVAGYLATVEQPGDPLVFAVPSGNLGNLTAGVLAARMGLPVARFIAATNVNDVLPEFIETGVYRSRPSVPTISNAMDVGDPSNFARLHTLYDGRADALCAEIHGERVSDGETRHTIRQAWTDYGVTLDPHGAVAVAAAHRWLGIHADSPPVLALQTAHPAKFGSVIGEELGRVPALPAHLAGWESQPNLSIELPDTRYETFRDWLGTGL